MDLRSYIEEKGGTVIGHRRVRCPFHGVDRNPSGSIYTGRDGKERYKCFSCDAHGDLIDLLQQQEGLSYGDARERAGFESSGGRLRRTTATGFVVSGKAGNKRGSGKKIRVRVRRLTDDG